METLHREGPVAPRPKSRTDLSSRRSLVGMTSLQHMTAKRRVAQVVTMLKVECFDSINSPRSRLVANLDAGRANSQLAEVPLELVANHILSRLSRSLQARQNRDCSHSLSC